MRRREPQGGGGPAHLAEFVAEDWPGGVSDAFDAWCEARRCWAEAHGWPGGESARHVDELSTAISLPDEPFDPYQEAT